MARARISRIDNDYVRQQDAAKQRESWVQHKRRVHHRRFLAIVGAFCVILLLGTVRYVQLHGQQAAAAAQLSRAEKKLDQAKTRKKALEVRVDQLNNEDYLEKLVRAQYYASRKGEVIFTLPASANRIPGADAAK